MYLLPILFTCTCFLTLNKVTKTNTVTIMHMKRRSVLRLVLQPEKESYYR